MMALIAAEYIGSLCLLVVTVVVVASSSASNLRGAICQYQYECRVGEVCDVWGSGRCECPAGEVRALDRTCHPVRHLGQACVWDLQCKAHDQHSLCHSQRCECASGVIDSDGECKEFFSFNSGGSNIWQDIGTPSPTRDKSAHKTIGAGTIAIGSLLVIFMCILLFLMVLHLKLRHRRLDEMRRILQTPTPIIRSRSYSEPGLRDTAPPSYNTLGPPSYEQAVGHPGTLSSSLPSELRAESHRVNIDPAAIGASTPIPIPGSNQIDQAHQRQSLPSAPPLYHNMDIEGIYANQDVIDQYSRSER